ISELVYACHDGSGERMRGLKAGVVTALGSGVVVASMLVFGVASASAATLSNISWAVSNNQVGATGVTYSYSFTAATTGTIKTVTFVVSGAGLAGTPTG